MSTSFIMAAKIEIPFGKGDEVLELEVANLPEPTETLGILQEQDCKIDIWIQLAVEYYKQGKDEAFELLLNECLSRWDRDRFKQSSATYPDGDKHRIKALDLLAIFYVRKGYATKNRERRRDYFARAAQKFTEVDKSEFINISKHGSEYQFHLLGRAYCCLIEGRNDQADAQFNFVLQQQQQSGEPENIPSLLGRACIEFNKKEASGKRNALSLYKKALQLCPSCPADVRLGLGICFFKLNMIEKAEEAFLKALAIDSKCVGALIGLAVIDLNKKTNVSIKRAMEFLLRAYKIEPNDAMVLTLLADHFFYRNELDKAIRSATRALDNTENELMQAQACYQLARAYHKKQDYDNAFEYYYKATTFGGAQFYLAHYGLGQMYIHRKEFESAIQSFESVHRTKPDNHETLKILSSLYARSNNQGKKDLALSYLKKVVENKPEDVEAWVELACLTEQNDTQTALSAYRKAINLYEAKSEPVPPEIYNNLAALLFSIDSLEESEENYKLALKKCQENMHMDELHYGSIIYTIKYNIGRLSEARHNLTEAEKIYKNILIQHPMYLDCYLRLGCMDRDKGLLFDASDRYKETFRIEPDNFEAWTLIANLHLSKGELQPCQKKFERILHKTENSPGGPDLYSLVQIGNVWLQFQYQPVRDKEKHKTCRANALKFFRCALRHDKRNIYAANGIGCILALRGLFDEAKDVFWQVQEATADFPDVLINNAHIHVEKGNYLEAVQLYENCIEKFYNNSNTKILSYIARALYKSHRQDLLVKCRRVLIRARFLDPHDIEIMFNLAKVLKTLARRAFESNSTYHQVVTAESELELARTYFQYYADVRSRVAQDKPYPDVIMAQREERDCKDLLLQVENSIKIAAEQRDKEESMRRQEQEEKLKAELARKAEEIEREAERSRLDKEEKERKRREQLKKQEEALQKMARDDSGAVVPDYGSDEGENRPKKKRKGNKEGRKRKGSEREKEKDKSPEKEKPDKDNKKYKSRALLSSDSSSSDSDQ